MTSQAINQNFKGAGRDIVRGVYTAAGYAPDKQRLVDFSQLSTRRHGAR